MGSSLIQLLVLAGIALFLILRLRDTLGTREGFEAKPGTSPNSPVKNPVIDAKPVLPDEDEIKDYVPEGSDAAKTLAQMKTVDSDFHVGEFLEGAKGAYEMILMAFEEGNLNQIEAFLSDDVMESFVSVVSDREDRGLKVEASFIGIREIGIHSADFDPETKRGEIAIRVVAELTSAVKNSAGEIVEGDQKTIKRQTDIWTFERQMDSDTPNWILCATGV